MHNFSLSPYPGQTENGLLTVSAIVLRKAKVDEHTLLEHLLSRASGSLAQKLVSLDTVILLLMISSFHLWKKFLSVFMRLDGIILLGSEYCLFVCLLKMLQRLFHERISSTMSKNSGRTRHFVSWLSKMQLVPLELKQKLFELR